MPHAVEIVYLQSSEAARKDHKLIEAALEHVAAAPGSHGIYYGFTQEDPNELYLFVVWETVGHHHAFMNDKVAYPKLGEAIGRCVVAPPVLFHVNFEPSDKAVAAALHAPVTSLSQITSLKPGATNEAILAELAKLHTSEKAPGAHGGGTGKLVERDEYALLYGWDRVEDHLNLGNTPQGAGLAGLVALVGGLKRAHVKLTTFKKYEP